MTNEWISPFSCYLIAFATVLISTASQILLKKQANQTGAQSFIKKFLNLRVILSYGLLALTMLLNQIALIHVPVSVVPCITATGFIWIYLFSFFALGEKPGKKKTIGVLIIVIGVIVSRLA